MKPAVEGTIIDCKEGEIPYADGTMHYARRFKITVKKGSILNNFFTGNGTIVESINNYNNNDIKYEGYIENNEKHGYGTQFFRSGKFSSQFCNNQVKGIGIGQYDNGCIFVGGYCEIKQGNGIFTWQHGSKLIGTFKDDLLTKGCLVTPNFKYEFVEMTSNLEDGQQIDCHVKRNYGYNINLKNISRIPMLQAGSIIAVKGITKYNNEDQATINVQNGFLLNKQFCGTGKMVCKDQTYEGQILNNTADGSGILQSPNSITTGQFKDGYANGQCTVDYTDGNKYNGGMENNYFKGKGRIQWKDGAILEGDFQLYEAKGVLKCQNKSYEGMLKYYPDISSKEMKFITTNQNEFTFNGHVVIEQTKIKCSLEFCSQSCTLMANRQVKLDEKYTGQGKIESEDGKFKYEGEIRSDKPHGQGKFNWNGNSFQGEFSNGFPYGDGEYVYSNGNRYKGVYKMDQPKGKGLFTFTNGDTVQGEFAQTKGQLNCKGMATYGGKSEQGIFTIIPQNSFFKTGSGWGKKGK